MSEPTAERATWGDGVFCWKCGWSRIGDGEEMDAFERQHLTECSGPVVRKERHSEQHVGRLIADIEQAEAQLAEAVRRLRNRQQYIHGNFHDIAYELDGCSHLGCKEVAALAMEGPDQPCERVSITPVAGPRFRFYICKRHDKPWGECP